MMSKVQTHTYLICLAATQNLPKWSTPKVHSKGATTFNIMTFGMMTLRIMTLSIMGLFATISIMI
jgi:hypothetical protein